VALPAGSAGSASITAPPQAARTSRPGWRDPRLWIGIAIVAACVVIGARVLGSADDTVAVWAVRADAGAGAVLSRADLEVHRVHFAADEDLAGYLAAADPLPDQLPLARPVGGGELLPRSALATGAPTDTVQLPLAVDPAQVPPAVRAGSVVDVYVVGDAAGTSSGTGTGADATSGESLATPALSAVTVVAAPGIDEVFGSGQTQRQLTLAVPERRAQAFFGLISRLSDPTITVVLRPAG
jgi:hypothetical protein